MDDDEKLAILDEIIRLTSLPRKGPGEFTVYDYLARLEERGLPRVARCTAGARMDRLVERGLLSKRDVLEDGKKYVAYKPTGDFQLEDVG